MLELNQLETIQNTFQTTRENILREYAQHLFLSSFYRKKGSENVFFKGGTALRFAYRSPRFSEDLDFSANKIGVREIEGLVVGTLEDFTNQGLKWEVEESKETTGGYLGKLIIFLYEEKTSVDIQISFRERKDGLGETLSIVNEYIPTYVIKLLPLNELVAEKIQAALTRSKPRDFFDIYFLLRERLIPPQKKESLRQIKEILNQREIKFAGELSLFLPRSMKTLAESFPTPLLAEIEKIF